MNFRHTIHIVDMEGWILDISSKNTLKIENRYVSRIFKLLTRYIDGNVNFLASV